MYISSISYLNRSGSSLTGKLLCQGLSTPNYVYEPLVDLSSDLTKQIHQHGFTQGIKDMGAKFTEELSHVLLIGRPRIGSLHEKQAIHGADPSEGGDIIVKTIRLRYHHLKGWIEEQQNLKVRG